jgi:4-carboxymuconolactone decarboxylase
MKRNAEVGLITKSSILNGKEQQFMDKQKFDQGLAVRREVLGDEYVDKAVAATTDFTRPMQELLNENCWGTIWTRAGLPRKTRSLVTLAFLSALRATTEIKSHVRGALRNGCTVQEIQEVLLQASVYVGVPAGIEAFRAAKEVIDTWKDERP